MVNDGRTSTHEDLSKAYQDIASRAILVDNWPDSTISNQLFRRDNRNLFQIPSFPVNEAPLAVAALLDRNPVARRILRECDQVFEEFLGELRTVFAAEISSLLDTGKVDIIHNIWRVLDGTHHITVATFQEHPSLLLQETDRNRWRPVPENLAEQIFTELSTHQEKLIAPILELDSLVITSDGVMIAGFVDRTNSFQKIRQSCIQIAETILGDLTSRPKKLIHVTLGRVLELPEETTPAQQRAVNHLVRLYNTRILGEKVASMRKSLPDEASFALTEVTLIRDVVWTLRKIKSYGSLTFTAQSMTR